MEKEELLCLAEKHKIKIYGDIGRRNGKTVMQLNHLKKEIANKEIDLAIKLLKENNNDKK